MIELSNATISKNNQQIEKRKKESGDSYNDGRASD
jgi:hypothetical protein